MSTLVATASPENPARFSRAHVALLLRLGVLDEGRFELCEGNLVEKMPQNRSHVLSCRRMTHALEDRFGRDRVGTAAPIIVDEFNEPEPDVFVTRAPLASYPDNPPASEVVLVVEISDATLRTDRTEKAERYARTGIPEYWLVDINGRRVLVFRLPEGESYLSLETVAADGTLQALAGPDQPLSVATVLP